MNKADIEFAAAGAALWRLAVGEPLLELQQHVHF